MSAEKKLWQLPTSFRRFSGKQNPQLNTKAGPPRSRVSSVYLSDNSSTSDFIIVPEFDDPIQSQTTEEFKDTPQLSNLPVAASPNPLTPNDALSHDPNLIGSHNSSYLDEGFCDTSVLKTSRNDDLTQRLDSAYAHIRSMPSVPSPRVSLSSDPQILRKQLGVPQHSVLNYPNQSSPDLPNPHTSPREPTTSPIRPPAASPDMSHARTSKNIGLRVNTNVYSSPDPFQPVQIKSVVTTPNLAESSPQCTTLDAHAVGAQKPPPSTISSSKLSKRHVEKTTVSPSSSPSSRRQPSRGVLRKPAASSPPSMSTYRRQSSLPLIRPPSPLRVDIPLHHTWHDRRTHFYSSSECHPKISQSHETKPRRISGSTDALASLAWIGTPPMTSGPYFTDRRYQSASPAFSTDHFRIAIAVEDDSISDEDLVDRLEMVRRIGSPSERSRDISSSSSSASAHFPSVGRDETGHSYTSFSSSTSPTPDHLAQPSDVLLPSPLISQDTASDSEDAAVWQAARKAVLCIREIVRTEKKYQEALKMLLNAETATPPPPSMTPYVSALVRASETLLKHFLEDPSAWGVSTAFVASEDELEATMVSWCAVAGSFFTDGNDHDPQSSGSTSRWRLRKSGMISNPPSAMKQALTPLSPQLPPMLPTISTANKVKGRTSDEHYLGQYPQAGQEKQAISVFLRRSESTEGQALSAQRPSRKLSVRDLAIQPIQRVMRYVLLYKDILDCTPPTSPSRLLVERALEAATRIARHCDRAQRNPAFCHTS